MNKNSNAGGLELPDWNPLSSYGNQDSVIWADRHMDQWSRNGAVTSGYPWEDVKMDSCLMTCCCLVAQLCPTLCIPVDWMPSGSSVPGISQARLLEWLPFPSLGIFLTEGLNVGLLHWQADSSLLSPQRSPLWYMQKVNYKWNIDIHLKCERMKLLEENIGKTLKTLEKLWPWSRQNFLQ